MYYPFLLFTRWLGGNPASNCNITFDISLIPCLVRPLPYFDLGPVVRIYQLVRLNRPLLLGLCHNSVALTL
jgi:hypothetical protein